MSHTFCIKLIGCPGRHFAQFPLIWYPRIVLSLFLFVAVMGFDADESGRTHSRINETAEQLEGLCMSPSTSNSLTHSVAQNSRGLRLHITHDQSVHDLQSIVATTPSVKLSYTIYGCSSYTNVYRPENILIDETTDQASRWASAANDSDQYIILQLEMPAIACMYILVGYGAGNFSLHV